MTKFSIITPTWNRSDGRLQRCLRSVVSQTHQNYEHIIVDDGSTDATPYVSLTDDPRLKYICIEHSGRVVARNAGMEAVTGEWVCWLDSDDAYDPMYLSTFAYHIEHNPNAKLWVCGAVVHGMVKENGKHIVPKWTTLRPAWMPPVDENGKHANFKSGKVGTGMFMFHRECLDKIGLMPPWVNHEDVAGGADEWLGYETGYKRGGPWCGNPVGDDYLYFHKLTQHFRVHTIDAALYIQYVR